MYIFCPSSFIFEILSKTKKRNSNLNHFQQLLFYTFLVLEPILNADFLQEIIFSDYSSFFFLLNYELGPIDF